MATIGFGDITGCRSVECVCLWEWQSQYKMSEVSLSSYGLVKEKNLKDKISGMYVNDWRKRQWSRFRFQMLRKKVMVVTRQRHCEVDGRRLMINRVRVEKGM